MIANRSREAMKIQTPQFRDPRPDEPALCRLARWRRRARRHGLRLWTAAAITSLALHVATVLAASAWLALWWGEDDLTEVVFAGEQRAVQINAVWSEEEPFTEPIEIVESSVPVEVTPHRARIERQSFVDTNDSSMASVQVEAPLIEQLIERLQNELATRQDSVADEPPSLDASTDHPPTPMPRTSDAPPPQSQSQVASVPSVARMQGTAPDVPPSFAHNRPPSYPELARQRGWEGVVLLRLSIDETGRVSDVKVARSSGYEILDSAAVIAVSQWRGVPAKQKGRPVATTELLPVRFKLN